MSINYELLRSILNDAVNNLDPNDVAQRLAAIHQDEAPPGVMSRRDDEYLVFYWGGRPLCAVFADDLRRNDLVVENFEKHDGTVPDTIPEEWTDP